MDSFELFHCQSPTPLLASFYERSCEGFCILQVEALLTNKNHNILDLLSPLSLVLTIHMKSLCYHHCSTLRKGSPLYRLIWNGCGGSNLLSNSLIGLSLGLSLLGRMFDRSGPFLSLFPPLPYISLTVKVFLQRK